MLAVHEAALRGDNMEVQRMLEGGGDKDEVDALGRSLLYWAATGGHSGKARRDGWQEDLRRPYGVLGAVVPIAGDFLGDDGEVAHEAAKHYPFHLLRAVLCWSPLRL